MLKYIIIIPFIILAMMTGNLSSQGYKEITRLDKLSHYIRYTNLSIPYEESYHIANALLTEGTTTLIAITKVESDFSPRAIGDKGTAIGAFQVRPHLWGKVSTNIYEQTRQALNVLQIRGSIKRYNGRGKRALAYEQRVKIEMIKLKALEI